MYVTAKNIESSFPRILCVDDDPFVVDAIGRQLHWYKVRVTKALHGMQGIWFSQLTKPDLIITDLKMPLCSGKELLEVVNKIAPVIFITGVRDENTRNELLAAGAAEVLFKPVDSRDLVEIIQRFVRLEKRR